MRRGTGDAQREVDGKNAGTDFKRGGAKRRRHKAYSQSVDLLTEFYGMKRTYEELTHDVEKHDAE